jgi:ribosomal protein S18 acetylase RimI-like enzyme
MARPEPGPVRLVTAHDWPAVARVLGRAFADDPVWSWAVRDKEHRAERIGKALAIGASLHPSTCDVISAADGSGLGAVAQWSPPGQWRLPNTAYLRIAPRFLWALGLSSLTKMNAINSSDKQHPTEPHWYLATLGTDPDQQGRGLASALLKHRLDDCDHDLIPAYLESTLEANIVFYERHGFRVVEEITLAKAGPRVWTMWRDPQPV